MRPVSTIVMMTSLFLVSSCSRAPKEEWKKSFAEIDNSTPETVNFFIDGQDKGTVLPYSIVRTEIAPGSHTYRIMKGAEELDAIEAKGEQGKVTTVNPKGLSAYDRISAMYGRTSFGTGEAVTDAGSPRTVNSYFGLLKDLPRSVTVEKLRIMGIPSGGAVSEVARDKLMKRSQAEMPPSRALAVVECHHAYYQDEIVNAFKVLGAAPKSAEIGNALISCVDSSARQLLVAKAYLALASYEPDIPEAKLTAWLCGAPDAMESESIEGDANYTEQGSVGTERIKAGARIASRRDDGALLRSTFARLPEAQQLIIFEGLTVNIPDRKEISPSLRKFLVSEGLRCFTDKQKTYSEIERDDFEIDEAFMKQMDEVIAAQKEPNSIRFWNSIWWRKLARVGQTDKTIPSTKKLVEIITVSRSDRNSSQFSDAIIDEATKALAARGESTELR